MFEFSGVVRDAFVARGHKAISNDLIPSETQGEHIRANCRNIVGWEKLDMIIAFPPCTHLCRSGARWWPYKQKEQKEAIELVRWVMALPVPRIAVENPVGILSTAIRKPDQIIQPWMFRHGEMKTTCLWLKNLPLLRPTNIVEGREQRIWKLPPSENRGKERSRTYLGIAKAMAEQWG